MAKYSSFQKMLTETRNEGDRSCALVLGANLDNRLGELLMAYFVEMQEKARMTLFQGNGPLSTFSSRISISWACGLLSRNEEHDLQIIRKIRNTFAHEEHGWSFISPSVSSRCYSLKMAQEARLEHPDQAELIDSPRAFFEITAASLTLLLMARKKEALNRRCEVYPPTSILSRRVRNIQHTPTTASTPGESNPG